MLIQASVLMHLLSTTTHTRHQGVSVILGLLLGTEAPVMMPNGIDFSFFFRSVIPFNAYIAADPEGVCYKALGFSPGFAATSPVSPYLKLLPMLAGIGSPGTIQEVPFLSALFWHTAQVMRLLHSQYSLGCSVMYACLLPFFSPSATAA